MNANYAYMKVTLGCRWEDDKGLYAVYQAVSIQVDGVKPQPARVIENWRDIPGNAKEVLNGATVMVRWEDGKGTCRVVTPQEVEDAFWNRDRLRREAENAGRQPVWPVCARNEM